MCAMQALSDIIGALLKPLRFASKDGFARVDTVKGLDGLVSGLCEQAASTGAGAGDIEHRFAAVKNLFAGFNDLPAAAKKDNITEAIRILESINGAISGQPQPAVNSKPRPLPDLKEVSQRLSRLKTPLDYVKGVGPKLAERLRKKGLASVEDMLYFLPIRYEDRRNLKKIKDLSPGALQVTSGEVMICGEVRYGRRRVFELVLGDGTGLLKIKWFNYKLPYMKRYECGKRFTACGSVTVFGAFKEMIHPDMEEADGAQVADDPATGAIVPVYSQIENFHQKTARKLLRNVVEQYSQDLLGGTPHEVLLRHGLVPFEDAVRLAHCPGPDAARPALARKTLVFDELFLLELALGIKRSRIKKEDGIAFFSADRRIAALEARLREILPFKLTGAQEKTLSEIKKDMSVPHPMNRLIQGDVGSGKTIVSFIAALWALEAGYQCAVMAPTEILAEQHYLSTRCYAQKLGIKTVLLTGSLTQQEKSSVSAEIAESRYGIVFGTHALIQKDVRFGSLGLVVIDEQHRFGVAQRGELRKKAATMRKGSAAPDMLIMTATPIPRTLSMTVFGDLDVSVMDELPPGRHPVETRILREKDRLAAYDFIKAELEKGNQAYIVYPLVEESEELSLKDATNMKEELQNGAFKDYKVGLVHGRMRQPEKESVMKAFKAGEIHVLAATTVIEVGVDVPNSTVILIEHAERFGLAQLHQLRGRVGRSQKKSYCLLLAQWTSSQDTYARLKVMEKTCDGFVIAEEDLKLRGPGEFLGTRQSGLPDFRLAEALTDLNLVRAARDEAARYLKQNPDILTEKPAYIKEVLKSRWEDRFELAEIG